MYIHVVVSREAYVLLFLVTVLNDIDILAADIQNAYSEVITKEKVYIVVEKKLGSDKGRPAVIVRALYGLKSSGARFRDSLVSVSSNMRFRIILNILMYICIKQINPMTITFGSMCCAMSMICL